MYLFPQWSMYDRNSRKVFIYTLHTFSFFIFLYRKRKKLKCLQKTNKRLILNLLELNQTFSALKHISYMKCSATTFDTECMCNDQHLLLHRF